MEKELINQDALKIDCRKHQTSGLYKNGDPYFRCEVLIGSSLYLWLDFEPSDALQFLKFYQSLRLVKVKCRVAFFFSF